eukprot:CAMPEP_0172492250 /NCGR_PEP_ID=MMETSP1066-20121228/23336_1 /TAXON_ID=671091 /ORGANISM="Coscinodiscus wailesii, Strain CCMP2513" /LENGTH=211 /DNA_ID=CAMNT_0013261759 /DNA_START=54 /DNA_END=689 /DNA_ORIENTATION=+
MIGLRKLREEKEKAKAQSGEGRASTSGESSSTKTSILGIGGKAKGFESGATKGKKRTPGEIRIQKDIADLDAGSLVTVDFPNPNNLTNFNVSITPDSGYWQGATYQFSFVVPPNYPHNPPKVHCQTKIYHPNINLQGNVCLNILRDDWKPVLDVNAVIEGLQCLFYDPNPNDPLNQDAAEMLRQDKFKFAQLVQRTLKGGILQGETFQKLV